MIINGPTLQTNKKQNTTIYEEFLFSRESATGTPKKHNRKTKLKLLKECQKYYNFVFVTLLIRVKI